MADRQETVVLDFEIDESDSVESINSITKASKALREERSKLNLQSAEGQKRVKEINAELDKNNSKIKDNVSALEKQRINVGNYKSALDGVHPALGKVATGLEAGTKGFKAFTLQTLAFLATPLGAALALIVTAFALIKAALERNAGLMDKFENVTNAVGVVVEVLTVRLLKLVQAAIAFATFDLAGAATLTAEAFGGLADEIGNAVTQQQLFLDASRDLEDAQRNLRIETAKQENIIKQLVVASKNRNLTFDQQEEKLKQALALEKDLVDLREDLARRDLLVTARRTRADAEFQQQSSETFDQYIERLLNSSKLSDAELDKIVEKVEALEQARGSSLAFQEKVENNLATIQEKRAAALEKQNAALAEQEALERAVRRAQNISDTSVDDPLVNAFQDRANVITDINDRLQDDLTERQKQAELERLQNTRKAAELAVEIERMKGAAIGNIIGTVGELFEQGSVEQKVLSSAQALINTYLAATAALASGSKINPVFGIVSAAAAVAAGLASVAKINGVQFAEGGWTGPGKKYDAVGIVHADEYVTPKRVRHMPEAQPHLMALERMRLRGYTDGGLVTSSISTPINQQLELANIVKNLPPGEVSVVEITRTQKRIKGRENRSKR